ncbi:MAG: DASH family cryptochrome [Cytophagales bacterium]
MKTGTIIVWFRNDLRLHDNEVLTKAINNSQNIIPIYCIDPRQFAISVLGTRKIGTFRAKFLLDSLADLRKSIHKLGGKLLVAFDEPGQVIAELVLKYQIKAVYAQKEIAKEETDVELAVEKVLWKKNIPLELIWGNTLFHLDDIPFIIKEIPDIFTNFRKRAESESKVRNLFSVPKEIKVHDEIEENHLPDLRKLGLVSECETIYKGGEQHAIERLDHYFWKNNLIKSYKETRNGLLGLDYSSKFSPWLANGCISPRFIYHEIKKYEFERFENESTYWLVFELLWRDYFKFVFKKYGNKFFRPEGIKNQTSAQKDSNMIWFENWKTGKTGETFVDANMRELAQTGFMSNRGRQNVASYLVHDLHINWLCGAAYFEEMLLDYDVCSNYGNWAYLAGVGNDPRENRKFNIEKQARDYDPNGEFVKFWMPELRERSKKALINA